MTSPSSRPNFSHVLGRLKDFQKTTVAHAFHRLYEAEDSSHRFLVADEVGLGKTVIASGVVARTIEHLWDCVDRIDIIYVCSNIDIARQNVNKLNVMGQGGFSSATRLTMLPLELSGLRGNKVNFVSFTPGTSFDIHGGTGHARERALLYCMLRSAWDLRSSAAPINVMSAYSAASRFRTEIDIIGDRKRYPRGIDPDLLKAFGDALADEAENADRNGHESLRSRFDALCSVFSRHDRKADRDELRLRNTLIGDLRHLLANTCIKALQPDLVILDEFQRFKDLLDGDEDDDAAELARELFTYSDDSSAVRVLLLSATPYKMYTMRDEAGDEDHYADFIATLRFLFNDTLAPSKLSDQLTTLRKAIYVGGDREALRSLRSTIEASLRRVMARTERLAASSDRSGMLREIASSPMELRADDASAYCAFQRIGRKLDLPDVIEFWKSAPFLLNFMDSYKLKEKFVDSLASGDSNGSSAAFRAAVRAGIPVALPHALVEDQAELTHPHPRTRWLMNDVVGRGAWRLLWLAPSLPYYDLRGPFGESELREFTKRLIFSAWHVAPKSIATLVSCEAERRMLQATRRPGESRTAQIERTKPLLNFTRSGGRLTGLPVLGLLYPSITLARLGDPLSVDLRKAGPLRSVETVLQQVTARLDEPLRELLAEANETPTIDERWYWAAPILLDLRNYPDVARRWLRRTDVATRWMGDDGDSDEDETSGWRAHVDRVLELLSMGKFHNLGSPPPDLKRALAEMAIGGPAVCALRALSRSRSAEMSLQNDQIRDAAGAVAHGFRGLFNLPEVISLIRGENAEEPYWRRTLEYSVDGCLQAVLDEYVHVLQSWEGVAEKDIAEAARDIAVRVRQALGLRTSRLGVDALSVAGNGRVVREAGTMRARFAMRFGDDASDDEKVANRKESVRAAFNSPFWPFVLASTSVGQEGLDFHLYCHAVVHWNIPPNPVDMEQREGRVHRFKGHAVRKNVATRYGPDLESDAAEDPWTELFELARMWREDNASDLVPYWVYTIPGGAVIERHVPHLPLSRDAARYAALRRSLAVYRMVFGQPRQEDLVEYLMSQPDGNGITAEDLRIDLTPPANGVEPHPANK